MTREFSKKNTKQAAVEAEYFSDAAKREKGVREFTATGGNAVAIENVRMLNRN